jgi:hypothetical protein
MPTSLDALLAQRQAILAKIAAVPAFRRGTVLTRSRCCGKPQCRCHRNPDHRHVQYQWTAKVNGKTQTKNLHLDRYTATLLEQTRAYHAFLALVDEYVRISEQIADRHPVDPPLAEQDIDLLKKKLQTRSTTRRRKNSTVSSEHSSIMR